VTDAALLLGYIDPDYFLGGRMSLDVAAAERAVGGFAEQLGSTTEAAAHAIMAVVNEQMVRAIQEITVNEGVDPREALLVAGGGASGLNIVPIARELGCSTVVVPRMASALSACGIQYSDLISEFGVSQFARSRNFPYEAVNEALGRIDAQAERFAAGLRGRGIVDFTTDYSVEARYAYQLWELEVQLPHGRFDGPEDLEEMIARFDRLHERIFAVNEPGQELECVYWRGRTRALMEKPVVGAGATNGAHPQATSEKTRRTFFPETGAGESPIYIADSLRPGMSIRGPAIIEEATTTIVVYPNSTAVLDASDSYVLAIDV
jgi:N-methylhydantoinase A